MEKDVFTNDNLPELCAQLADFSRNLAFSDEFRAACLDAIDAIERAVADDAAVNARLQLALDSWKLAANAEVAE